VLFSSRDKCWKLADFGSASAATSKKLVTTVLGRGTEGYRAPEVLRRCQCNKRSDIFALGCIAYEIVTGQKLFDSDWDVIEYAQKGIPLYPAKWPPCKSDTRLRQLGEFTSTLIGADPTLRLSAKATAQELTLIRRGNQENKESDDSEDDDDDCEPAAAVRFEPVVQPSLRRRSTHLNPNRMQPNKNTSQASSQQRSKQSTIDIINQMPNHDLRVPSLCWDAQAPTVMATKKSLYVCIHPGSPS
jgi:serine/threonine protein kinase